MVVTKGKPNFTEGPIFTRLLVFTLPIIATSLLAVFYNMADNIVVGQFSGDDNALAAVGQTSAYNNLLANLVIGIGAGAGVVVAQLFGAKRREELSRAVHTSMLLAVVMGLVMMVAGLSLSRLILSTIIAPENHALLLDKATLYMLVVSIGLPAASVYNFGAAILRSVGDSKSPLIIGAVSGLLNVGLNLVFVILFHMSIVGVALATVISHYASAIAVVYLLVKNKNEDIRLSPRCLAIDKTLVLRVLYCGVPAAVQSAIFSFANMILASAVGTLPVETISANTIASNIDGITYQCMNGFATSVLTFVGQNFGALKEKRIWRSFLFACLQVSLIGIAVAALELTFAEQLCNLFVSSTQANRDVVIEKAESVMRTILIPYFLCGIMGVFGGFLRGLGFSIQPMIASVVSVLAVRLTWIFIFFPMQPDSIEWLYLCFPITWIVTLIIEGVMILIARKKLKTIISNSEARAKNVEATV